MTNLPKIISTKDASYLSDMFNWYIITAKKYNHYTTMTCDNRITKLLNKLIDEHLDFCANIIKILESGEKND